jgi:hypothetical protein
MYVTSRTVVRRVMTSTVAALLTLFVAVSATGDITAGGQRPAAPVDSWAQPEHDAQGRNFNPGERQLDGSTVTSLTRAWTSSTNRFDTWVVSAGRVFRLGGEVVASRVGDGSTIWSYGYEDCWSPYRAVATPSRVFVYFDDQCSVTGATDQALVTAFDSSTGDILWEVGPSQWVLWMGLVGDHLLLETEGPFGITSLDPATGNVQWSNDSDSLDGSFAADRERIYFAGWDYANGEQVVASFNLSDGAPIWSRPMGPSYDVVVGPKRLFIYGANASSFESVTRVVDKDSGAALYRLRGVSVAAFQPGVLFTRGEPGLGEPTKTLTARQPWNGKVIWSRNAGGPWERLALANGLAYASRRDGSGSSLYVYRSDNGKLLLKRRTTYDRVLAVTGGQLYLLRTTDDAVVALHHTGD